MNKHTPQQLLEIAKTEPEKLNELVAIAQGWTIVTCDDPSPFGIEDRPYWNNFSNPEEGEYVDEYSPTTNDRQMMELAVKLQMKIHIYRARSSAEVDNGDSMWWESSRPNIAVVMAAILYLQEKE